MRDLKLKIAIIYYEPFEPKSQNDSIPIGIYDIASRLALHHNIIVYSPRGRHQKKIETINGVQYRRISAALDDIIGDIVKGISRRIPGFERAIRKRPYYTSIFNKFTYILKVAKEIQSMKCDIVHIHEQSEFVTTIRALNPNIQILLHMHCEWLTQLDHSMIEHRLKQTDLILSCSMYITNKIQQNFPSVAGRCQTLYNEVDLAAYTNDSKKNRERPESKQLLFISRVTPEKGPHVLIKAFKEVVEKYPRVHLEIVGILDVWGLDNVILLSDELKVQKLASFHRKGSSRSYLDYLKHRLVSLNISEMVTFHGRIPYEEKIKMYKASDIVVQPSIFHEPFGRAVIEAMACQLPVVGSRVGGISEIIEEGRTGFLVEAGDSHALANAILKLLSNEDLMRKMGESGRRRVELFSVDNITTNLLCFYEDMVKSARTP